MLRTKWTEEEDALVELMGGHIKWTNVTKFFGNTRSYDAVRNRWKRLHPAGIKEGKQHEFKRIKYEKDEDDHISQMKERGWGWNEIAKQVNRTPQGVRNRYNRQKRRAALEN